MDVVSCLEWIQDWVGNAVKFFAGEGPPSKRAVRAARPVFIESREAFQRLDTFMQREYGHASLRAAGGAL